MRKPLLFLAAGLLAGFAVSVWFGPAGSSDKRPSIAAAALADRVAALEDALGGERARVAALAAEITDLRARLEASADPAAAGSARGAPTAGAQATASGRSAAAGPGGSGPTAEAVTSVEDDAAGFRGRGFRRAGFGAAPESRVDRFVAAGFSADRAAYLDRRASELRMQALEAEYEAARSGKPADAEALLNPELALRDELGDADYERYLEALDRPTRVAVRDVLASSPAEKAGLQPGDEITSYDGRRVFDVRDLSRLSFEGQAGDTVTLEIVRDGQPMQIYVPRGPLGITGGRGRFGGRP